MEIVNYKYWFGNNYTKLAYKVVNSNLTIDELRTIKAVVETLVEQFLKNNEK